jgi:hypothetical protein
MYSAAISGLWSGIVGNMLELAGIINLIVGKYRYPISYLLLHNTILGTDTAPPSQSQAGLSSQRESKVNYEYSW